MKGSTFKRCRCRGEDGRDLNTSCPDLRRSDGSYNPSHGAWAIRVELPPGEDGKRKILRRFGFASQRDALAALDEVRGKTDRGVDPTRKLTVREYLTEWLDGKRDIRATTRRSYVQHISDYLIAHLGRIEISQLRRSHVEAMFEQLMMGAATKQRIRATLRSALADAEREGLILSNAARLARLETGKRPKIQPLEPKELGKLLDHVTRDRLGALFEVIAATGLRRGEALGLRWQDLDLDHGGLVVRQQLVQLGQGHHDCPHCAEGHRGMLFAKPKTTSGEARTVDLDSNTVGVLLAHKAFQEIERDTWGDAYSDHGLAFATETGQPLYGDSVTKRFGELCDEAGVRRVRVHDLRHGRASLLLAAGVDIAVVSKILGHGSISITSDTYAHLLEGVGKAAAEAASALVPRAPRAPSRTPGHPPGTQRAPEE
jgi:integrase